MSTGISVPSGVTSALVISALQDGSPAQPTDLLVVQRGSQLLRLPVSGVGGGTPLYDANPVAATDPSATGDNAVAIGSAATATTANSIAFGTSADATGTVSI